MRTWVIDASVIMKWFLKDSKDEKDIPIALELLKALREDNIEILQPIHWLVEVAAVVTRVQPKHAEHIISLLDAMTLPVCHNPIVLNIACRLSKTYKHHLFDTLYHAVALSQSNTTLITADLVYFNKVCKEEKIIRLSDFSE